MNLNQRGVSIIEVMVMSGIMVAMLTAFMSLMSHEAKSVTYLEDKLSSVALESGLRMQFANPNFCKNLLGGVVAPLKDKSKDITSSLTKAVQKEALNKVFQKRGSKTVYDKLELKKIILRGSDLTAPDSSGMMSLMFYQERMRKGGGPPSLQPINIKLGVKVDPSLKVESCRYTPSTLWSANGSDIYYNSGNVGIGTADPSSHLQVTDTQNANTGILVENYNSGSKTAAQVRLSSDAGVADFLQASKATSWPSATILRSSTRGGLHLQSVNSVGFVAIATNTTPSGPIERVRVNANGNVGVGTSSPAYKLHVNGSVAGVGAYKALSDRRFKRNIVTLSDALRKVQSLRGVSFDWDREAHPDLNLGTRRELGVIAQEVEEVFPEAVSTDKHGVKSVSYSMLISPLIEAVKELTARWASDSQKLNLEVQSLREENIRIKEEISSMRKENMEIKTLLKDLIKRKK